MLHIVYGECQSDDIYEYIHECIWSIISLPGLFYMGEFLTLVQIVCNECHHQDWTKNNLFIKNNLNEHKHLSYNLKMT